MGETPQELCGMTSLLCKLMGFVEESYNRSPVALMAAVRIVVVLKLNEQPDFLKCLRLPKPALFLARLRISAGFLSGWSKLPIGGFTEIIEMPLSLNSLR